MADLYEGEEDNLYSDKSEDENSNNVNDQQNSSAVDDGPMDTKDSHTFVLKPFDIYFSGLLVSHKKWNMRLLMTNVNASVKFTIAMGKDPNKSKLLFQVPFNCISKCRLINGYCSPFSFIYFDLKPEATSSLKIIQDALKAEKARSVHLGDSETYIRICLNNLGNRRQKKFETFCNIPLEVGSSWSIARIPRGPIAEHEIYDEEAVFTFTCYKVQIGSYIIPRNEFNATIVLTPEGPKIILMLINMNKGYANTVLKFINKSNRKFNQSILSAQRSGWIFSFREYQLLDMKRDLSMLIRVPNLEDYFDGYSQDEEKRFIKLWASPESVDYSTALEKLQVIYKDIPNFSFEPLEDEPTTRKERSKRRKQRKESESSETVKQNSYSEIECGSEESNRLSVVNLHMDLLYLGLNNIRNNIGVVFSKDSIKFDSYSRADDSYSPLIEFPTSAVTRTRFGTYNSGYQCFFFFHFNMDSSLALLDMIKNKLKSEVGIKRVASNDQSVLRICVNKKNKEKLDSLFKFIPNLEVCSDAEARQFEIIPTPAPFIFTCSRIICGSFDVVNCNKTVSSVEINSIIPKSGRLLAKILKISIQNGQVVEIYIANGNFYMFSPKKNGDGWILRISTSKDIRNMPGSWENHYNPYKEPEKYITFEVDTSSGSLNPDYDDAYGFFMEIFNKVGRFELVEPIQLPPMDSNPNDNASIPSIKRDPPPSVTPSRPQKKTKTAEKAQNFPQVDSGSENSDGDYSDGEEKEADLNEFRIPRCLNIFYDGWFLSKANDVGISLQILKDSVNIEIIKIGVPSSILKISLPLTTVESCKLLGAGSDDLNFIYLDVRESQKPHIIKNMAKADAQFIAQEGDVEDLKKLRICTKSLSRKLSLLREVIPREKLQIIYGNPEIPQVPGDILSETFKMFSFSPIAFNFGRYAYFVTSSVSIQVETSLPRWQWKPQIFISLDSPDKSMGLKLNGFDERIRFTLTEYQGKRWILFIKHFSNDFIKEFSSQLNLDVNLLDFCNPESNDPLRMYLGIIFQSSQKERKKAFGQIREMFEGQTNFRISDIQNVHSEQTIDITKDPGPTTFNFRCSSVHFGSLATLGRNSILVELKENGKPMITLSVFNTNGKENKHTIRFKNSNEYILTKYGLEGWILFLGVDKLAKRNHKIHPDMDNFFQPGSNDTKLKYISLVVQSKSSKQRGRDVDAIKGMFGNLKNFYFNPDLKPLIRNVENNLESNCV